jgi:hypothetical protein
LCSPTGYKRNTNIKTTLATLIILSTLTFAPQAVFAHNETTEDIASTTNRNFGLSIFSSLLKAIGIGRPAQPSVTQFRSMTQDERVDVITHLAQFDAANAWKYLKSVALDNNDQTIDAHQLGHIIGHSLYDQKGFAGIMLCDTDFGYACYHGVSEKFLEENGPSKTAEAAHTCKDLFPTDAESQGYASCVHGLGHGLMAWYGLDLQKALLACDAVPNNVQENCYDGVFMEYSFLATRVQYPTSDPWSFCKDLDPKYYIACARNQPTLMHVILGLSTADVAKLCLSAGNDTLEKFCITRVGFDLAAQFKNNAQELVNQCSGLFVGLSRAQCITAAADEFVFQEYPDWNNASTLLCNALPGDQKPACLKARDQTIQAYGRDIGERSEQVSRVAPVSGIAPPSDNLTVPHTSATNIFSTVSALINKFFPGFSAQASVDSPSTFGEFGGGTTGSSNTYPEIKQILSLKGAQERAPIYRKLIERVGPALAQEALYHSGLPFTGETHLIQHEVGYYLYETEGKEGVTKCTLYFLAACYHGLIISLLGKEGVAALPGVMEDCWQIGGTVAVQCAHGIGHGLVAWYGYKNLDQALKECDSIAKQSENFPIFNCYDGAFMENQWGLHDDADASDRWLSDTDPLYPCDDPRVKPQWLKGCWANQASIMYQFYKGDIGKVSDQCLKLKDTTLRDTCFNNLSRQIHPLTKSKLSLVTFYCNQLDVAWRDYCATTVASSDFSVGGRSLPYEICQNIRDEGKSNCYNKLISIMNIYAKNQAEMKSFCAGISDPDYQSRCLNTKESS